MFKKFILKSERKNKKKIRYRPSRFIRDINPDFKRAIFTKTIVQSIKELDLNQITLSFDDFGDAVSITENLIKKNISLLLADSTCAQNVSDYFLEKIGLSIPVVGRVRDGLYVYGGGEKITVASNVYTLDLISGQTEYIIKDVIFPVKINSLNILNDALDLTEKNLSDIIIKPCIICAQGE